MSHHKMQIFCKNLKMTSIFQTFVLKNHTNLPQCKTFSSDITPVKMAFNIFESETTNPNATPLLIMHGLFGSKQNWRGIGQALEKKTKRKIYSVDARNHGDSPHVPLHNSAAMAADIRLLMQEQNLKKLCVLGHSMGGRTMMFFSLNYPELVEKAIIVDISPVSMPKNFGEMEEIFLAMKNVSIPPENSMAKGRIIATEQMKQTIDKGTIDFILLNLKKLESGEFVWRHNVDALHANFSDFRNKQQFNKQPFNGPVLFIAGKESSYLKPADWPKIKELFPNAEIKWLENAGHSVHFDQPDKFIELVADFLRE